MLHFTVAHLMLIRRLCEAETKSLPIGAAGRAEATEAGAIAALLADRCVAAADSEGLLAEVRRARDVTSHVLAFPKGAA